MANDKVLKFQVAIQDNATKGLDEIEKKFLGLSNQAVTVVGNINKELQKLGGVSFTMPDLTKFINQMNKVQESVSKKNVGDIPIFQKTLEQMQQLQNFIGKNTLGGELTKIKQSINSVFAEIPNVSASSFTSYFNQLSKAYNDFISKIGNSRGTSADLSGLQNQIQRMGTLSGNDSLLRDYQSQAEQIKATILNTIKDVYNSINSTKSLLSSNSLDFGKISENIDKATESLNKLAAAFRNFNGTIGGDKNLVNMMAGMGEIIRSVKLSMNQLEEGNKNLHLSKSMQDFAKSINEAKIQMVKLEELNDKINRTAGRGLDKLGVDATNTIRQRQTEMLSIFSNLQQIINGGGIHPVLGLTTSQYMGSAEVQGALTRAKREEAEVRQKVESVIRQEEQAEKSNEAAKRQSAQATAQAVQEENRLSQAIQQTTSSAHGQSQILSDLKSMTFQYLSLYGMQSFITNMAQITGELQLQAKSLEVILNNASAAKQMYGEIRDLSQMSPYSFEDLLKSHRQLAAFGIEPKDMFATMKSLADIGAGLDVDISRLILAYGHTRSYGYLSGIQNRQFENAGIDMIGGLAAKYNRQADEDKRAGREAQYVTRADIFKRMRARSIPFEDVQDVVLDLDRPGGKFYNMQQRQFETLGGKLRNLRNNYRIMMSELGNDNQGLLLSTVGMINDLTENWERYFRILKGGAAAFAVLKLAGLASNRALVAANKELTASTVARNSVSGATAYLNGSMNMWGAMGSSRKWLDRNVASAANNNAVINLARNTEMSNVVKQRIALSSKLTAVQRAYLLQSAGVTGVEARRIALLSPWKRGLLGVRLGMIGVAQSAKAMAVSLLANPMTWLMAAVAGLTALSDKMSKSAENAKNFANTMRDTAQTDIQGLNELLEPYERSGILRKSGEQSVNSNGQTATKKTFDVDEAALEAHGLENVFDELKRALQVQSPFYEGDYFDVMKADGQAKQVAAMFDKLENTRYVKQVEQMSADRMEVGLKNTGTNGILDPSRWFNGEGLGENMKDYADAQASYATNFRITETEWNAFKEKDKKAIEQYVQELGISRDEAVRKYIENKGRNSFTGNIEGIGDIPLTLQAKVNDAGKAAYNQLDTAKKDMPKMANTFASVFKDSFSGNVDGMMTFFEDSMNKMFEEAKIGSPEAQEELSSNMAVFIRDAMVSAGDKAGAEQFMSAYWERQIGVLANKLVSKDVNENTDETQINKIVDKDTKAAIDAFKKSNKVFADEFGKMGDAGIKELISRINKSGVGVANSLRNMLTWQGRAKRMGIAVQPTIDVDYTEFIAGQRKMIKEAKEKLQANEKRIKFVLGVDVMPDINFKNTKQVEAFIRLIRAQKHMKLLEINSFIRNNRESDGYIHDKGKYQQLQELRGQMDSLNEYEGITKDILKKGEYLDNEHQSWVDDKNGKTGSGKSKRTGNKSGNGEDKFAKEIRSQAQLLGDAYSEYKKWKDKIGDEGALGKIQELFFGKDSALTKAGFSFKDIPNYYDNLLKLRKKLDTHYDTKKGHNSYVLDAINELNKSMNQVNFDNFSENSERWASKVALQLDRLTKKWEQYNKILSTTGDRQLAMSLSGLNAEQYRTQADELKEIITSEMNRLGVTTPYAFDVDASDKQIEDSVKNMLGAGAASDKIKSVVEELKKWRDLQKQINDESVETYANLTGGLARFADIVRKANSEYETTMQKLSNGLKSGELTKSQYNEGEMMAAAKRDRATNEASFGYKNLTKGNIAISIKSATANANVALGILDRQLKDGAISAEEYSKKVNDINTALNTFKDKKNTTLLSSFLKNGWQGVMNTRRERDVAQFEKYSQEAETAVKRRNDAKKELEKNPDDMDAHAKYIKASLDANSAVEKVNAKNEEIQNNDKYSEQYKKFSDTMNNVVDGLNKFKQSIDLLGSIFDSLGMEGAANAMADMSTIAGGAIQGAGTLAFLGPWGMAAGGALGLIGGFARAHDNRIERQINDLKEDVSKIEGYAQTIAKAQERTLGYDMGNIIRGYQQQYSANTLLQQIYGLQFSFNKEGAAGKAMADYYNAAGGGDVNGYQQQFNLLTRQREDYANMYNKENGKKKKSSSALEEYKQKISELDDQLRFFSEDTAKTLWGADVKSWADQLSDALANAFENGENAAKAYQDTVRGILQSLGSQMIKIGVMEPMFEKLQTSLFGDGKANKGVFNLEDIKESSEKVTDIVADFFGNDGDGQKAILAATEAWNAYEKGLNDAGLSVKSSSNSTLSSDIQGTSEETSDLLGGYINALRQDVSVIRIMKTQFINEAWPDYIKQITGMATTLGRIDANVAAIRSIISESGVLYERVNDLADDLHGLVLGTKQMHIA